MNLVNFLAIFKLQRLLNSYCLHPAGILAVFLQIIDC